MLRAQCFLALSLALSGCANFYTFVAVPPDSARAIAEHDVAVAVSVAREVAELHALREDRQLNSPPAIPSLVAHFGDGQVWLQVWCPGGSSPIQFAIGELAAWGESERTQQIRESLLSLLAQRLPALRFTVTTRRDWFPFGP
ncbi:MAG: hypothetical protein KC492_00755 [Myxococcales bacterium]|nr:hypothetical protein [Myxococcales bacterium]